MKKKQALVICICLITFSSLMVYDARASITAKSEISSFGNITPGSLPSPTPSPTPTPTRTPSPTPTLTPTPKPTPAPTPTPSPSSPNLEPLSAFYADMNGAASSYASLDYSTLHNGVVSMKIGPDNVRGTREVDGAWLGVKPGDHVVASVYIKTSSGVINTAYTGGRIGIDMYTNTVQQGYTIVCSVPHAYTTVNGVLVSGDGGDGIGTVPVSKFQVPFGNGWTLVGWNYYVPTKYFTYDYAGNSISPVQINSLVMWIDGRELTDGTVWFADPSLYINP